MKKDKVTFLQEKEVVKKAQKTYEFIENSYVDNPIKAKFLAFQKTKQNITFKDLI